VSSLGVGGTNAHLIIEEAPPPVVAAGGRPFCLLVLSAKTTTALDAVTVNLARVLRCHPTISLADAAYTLQVGRRAFNHRRALICRNPTEAAAALEQPAMSSVRTTRVTPRSRPVVYMFPGGGSQYAQMGMQLYQTEPVFREIVEYGVEVLDGGSHLNLRRLLLGQSTADQILELRRPSMQLPAIFLIEVALAGLWRSWGVHPTALLGHSMGEIAAAHLAGVFTFKDALSVISMRGELAENAVNGEMLSVGLAEDEIAPLLTDQLDLAAVNAPGSCVVSGPPAAIKAFARQLADRGVQTSRVPIAAAAHSRLLDPILGRFAACLDGVQLRPPSIPFISNVTGTWVTARQATDPSYWVRQLRSTVRFSDGVQEVLRQPDRLFLEVGPGETLSTFVRLHPDAPADAAVATLSQCRPYDSEVASVLDALGQLWLAGVEVDWPAFAAYGHRRRIPLPTYPFEGQRHWLAPATSRASGDASAKVHANSPGKRLRELRRRVFARAGGRSGRIGRRPNAGPVTSSAAPEHEHWPKSSGPVDGSPRTEVEQEVAAVFQEALGAPRIGINDDFFALGGTSLLSALAVARINDAFSVELTALTLLESPTVAALAERVEAARRTR
jgi:acyl transferase domain-containing protein/acyl carrier protein